MTPSDASDRRGAGVCFSFRHLPRPAAPGSASAAACSPMRATARSFFYLGAPLECPTPYYYLIPATRAAVHYAQLAPATCDPSLEDTLVAHVRSGDQMRTDHNASAGEEGINTEYGQPPLAYYLAAWSASGKRRLLVIAEDDSSPTVKILRLMATQVLTYLRTYVLTG